MKNALLFASLAATPAFAEELVSSTKTSSSSSGTTTSLIIPASQTTQSAPSFLRSHGIVTSHELAQVLSTELTSEKRQQFDQAVAKRNAALAQANEELSATLRSMLGESNEGLAKRVDNHAENKRLEAIRRNQPARYLYLLEKREAA